jgi:hypothetical protein
MDERLGVHQPAAEAGPELADPGLIVDGDDDLPGLDLAAQRAPGRNVRDEHVLPAAGVVEVGEADAGVGRAERERVRAGAEHDDLEREREPVPDARGHRRPEAFPRTVAEVAHGSTVAERRSRPVSGEPRNGSRGSDGWAVSALGPNVEPCTRPIRPLSHA